MIGGNKWLILAVALALSACQAKALDDWVAEAPADAHLTFAPELAEDAVRPVADERMPEAVALLATTPSLRVLPEEVNKLCACQVETAGTDSWYLVRAIRNGVRGGRYGVRGQDGSYDVYYGVLSHQTASDEKAAVFVRLPAPPKAIYAGASVVE
jgi:hypothetical protein